jgi:hypothetical protein
MHENGSLSLGMHIVSLLSNFGALCLHASLNLSDTILRQLASSSAFSLVSTSRPPLLNKPDAISRQLTSSLACSLVSTHASSVGTSWPPFFNQPDATSRQLAGALSRVGAHELRRHLAVSVRQLNNPLAHSLVSTTSCQHSSPCVPGLQRDGCHSSSVRQLTGSRARRRALLFALDARRISTCIAPCMHARRTLLCPMVPNHTQITASNGIQPYAVRSSVYGFSHTLPEPSPSVG